MPTTQAQLQISPLAKGALANDERKQGRLLQNIPQRWWLKTWPWYIITTNKYYSMIILIISSPITLFEPQILEIVFKPFQWFWPCQVDPLKVKTLMYSSSDESVTSLRQRHATWHVKSHFYFDIQKYKIRVQDHFYFDLRIGSSAKALALIRSCGRTRGFTNLSQSFGRMGYSPWVPCLTPKGSLVMYWFCPLNLCPSTLVFAAIPNFIPEIVWGIFLWQWGEFFHLSSGRYLTGPGLSKHTNIRYFKV